MRSSPEPVSDDQIWKNFVFNEEMTSKMQRSCRLQEFQAFTVFHNLQVLISYFVNEIFFFTCNY